MDTDINLDGLVANRRQTYKYRRAAAAPRGAGSSSFPQLTKPGVYVIDFIGNGKSSRALIRKGRLRPLVATGTGRARSSRVIDERTKLVPGAIVWLGGHEYKCGQGRHGSIVPFSTAAGPAADRHLAAGDFASLDFHRAPAREPTAWPPASTSIARALLDRSKARRAGPAGLFLNGMPVSLKLLEEVRLRITSVDHDGIAASTEVPDFKLFEDRESIHEFRVPGRLAAISFTLTAEGEEPEHRQAVDAGGAATRSAQRASTGPTRSRTCTCEVRPATT